MQVTKLENISVPIWHPEIILPVATGFLLVKMESNLPNATAMLEAELEQYPSQWRPPHV